LLFFNNIFVTNCYLWYDDSIIQLHEAVSKLVHTILINKERHKSIINYTLQIWLIYKYLWSWHRKATGVFNVFLYSQKYGTIYITVKLVVSYKEQNGRTLSSILFSLGEYSEQEQVSTISLTNRCNDDK
jgi:hypothetical protein